MPFVSFVEVRRIKIVSEKKKLAINEHVWAEVDNVLHYILTYGISCVPFNVINPLNKLNI